MALPAGQNDFCSRHFPYAGENGTRLASGNEIFTKGTAPAGPPSFGGVPDRHIDLADCRCLIRGSHCETMTEGETTTEEDWP
jgi:hypothetical protein